MNVELMQSFRSNRRMGHSGWHTPAWWDARDTRRVQAVQPTTNQQRGN